MLAHAWIRLNYKRSPVIAPEWNPYVTMNSVLTANIGIAVPRRGSFCDSDVNVTNNATAQFPRN